MRAVCWCGSGKIETSHVPDPRIVNPRDAIVRVKATAICGSDLHLYGGCIPGMQRGDILGHEFMGEVVEVGPEVRNLAAGDRVVVPFTIACGNCFFCRKEVYSLCDNSNPNARMAETLYGFSGSGLFGYTHIYGGYAGGQAEYVRVPFADVGPALRRLAQRYRLAVISNADRHLLGASLRHFPVRFDALITAEDARAYKPDPAVFRFALERIACPPQEIAHVAFGADYDLAPAQALSLRAVFLNRQGAPRPDALLEAEIHAMDELLSLWDR